MSRHRSALAFLSGLLLLAGLLPMSAQAATVWRYNIYRSSGFLYQDPFYTACTAAATMMMLNFIDLADTGGEGFRWTLFRTKNHSDRRVINDMTSILSFARSHDTLSAGRPGSDPHGWRNALNYYGWGSIALTNASKRVYDDRAYGSFDSALKGAVMAMARYHMPVGVLAWAGQHAQVATGYVVTGEDPATSSNFTVNGLYLSDPLHSSGLVNRYINRLSLLSGSLRYRLRSYQETDSPLDDPYTAGWRRSSIRSSASEWYRRWVLIVPTRSGLTDPDPTPTPTPDPTPSPDPTPTPDPTATATPTADTTTTEATPAATPTPTATPAATPSPEPSTAPAPPEPTPEPSPSASPSPTESVAPAG